VHRMSSLETGREGVRLGVLISHPIQYFSPWFRDLARVLDLQVFYIHRQTANDQARAGFGVDFDWDVPLLTGYEHAWLKNEARKPGVERFFGCDVPTLKNVLRGANLDALLVFGWRHKSSWQAYRACRQLGIPILMKGDSGLHTPRSHLKRAVKRMLYGFLLPRFDGHLYIGKENKAYLEHYGVDASRLFFSPLSVDREWFTEAASEAEKNGEPARLRSHLGIDPGSFVFLFVGKFSSVKRPDLFLQAFLKMKALNPSLEADAVLVGDGPLRPRLEELCTDHSRFVHLVGFKNQTELATIYRMADALVLPGHDSWGLVVNEAAACGVPALVSDRVGCARDLIVPGKTGFVFEHGNIDDLARRMFELHRCVQEDRLGIERSLAEKCAVYDSESATRGLLSALEHVVGGRQRARERESETRDDHANQAQRHQRKSC